MSLLRLSSHFWLAFAVGLGACSEPLPTRLELGQDTAGEWPHTSQALTPESWFPSPWPGVSAVRLLLAGLASPPDLAPYVNAFVGD